jgi:hypothetical protein
MSMPSQMDVIVAPETGATGSYVDWPAIIAGVIFASAISLVLLTFGSAIGLSFINFHSAEDVMPLWVALAAALWLLWVQVSSFMAGAYLTGRMRRRHGDASEHESDVRDGAHGLLVWGGALVVGAIIATSGIGAAANAVGSAAATVTDAASNVADGATLDPNAYFVDTLFRTAPGATPVVAGTDTTAVRGEAGRILLQGAVDGVGDADRAYLAQLVATNTGLTQDEATARVNEVMTAVEEAKAQAAAAAESARKMGVLAAFLTAASLLVSAAAAFWAAQKGGNHRDEGTAFLDVFRRT